MSVFGDPIFLILIFTCFGEDIFNFREDIFNFGEYIFYISQIIKKSKKMKKIEKKYCISFKYVVLYILSKGESFLREKNIGDSPSGKAHDYDSCMHRFESYIPSQLKILYPMREYFFMMN